MSRAVKFLYLTQEQVIECGGLDMVQTMEAVEKVFSLLDAGECIEPHAPSIRWGGLNDRRISMHPAYVGGDVQVAGIKWIPSNPENPIKRNMPRSNGVTILNDPETGLPSSSRYVQASCPSAASTTSRSEGNARSRFCSGTSIASPTAARRFASSSGPSARARRSS